MYKIFINSKSTMWFIIHFQIMSYVIQVIHTYNKKHIWNIYKIIKKIVINLIHVLDVQFLKPTVKRFSKGFLRNIISCFAAKSNSNTNNYFWVYRYDDYIEVVKKSARFAKIFSLLQTRKNILRTYLDEILYNISFFNFLKHLSIR